MNFNLVDKLSNEDRIKIENYIRLYGTQVDFIGIDEWLKYWGASKIKMYKLLGNQFIYRVPFKYNKSEEEIHTQILDLVIDNVFVTKLKEWCFNNEDVITYPVRCYITTCLRSSVLTKNENPDSIKFELPGAKKILQFQSGMKPLKALNKFLMYCKDCKELEGVDELIESYEQFRLAHSRIFNDNVIKGNMVISIHPLDFMTMSDNNSNWQSCMSWKDNGCYHVGTIEMMNSNNVLCCYIENSDPYYFSNDKEEQYQWSNKKWRQLVYFNKDIIVCGKAYPYANDDISKSLIKIIQDLAEKNLNWTYQFGPELYQDMKHLYTSYSVNRARGYIRQKNMKKHNIIFDTKGMYNDMLNDHGINYWCVRNKVKHNKIISYSGKAPCLCCGKSIIYPSFDEDDYNSRYENVGSAVCKYCIEKNRCDICGEGNLISKKYTVYSKEGVEICICENCVKEYIRKCPDCGEPFFVNAFFGRMNSPFGSFLGNGRKLGYIKLQEDPLINTKEYSRSYYGCDNESELKMKFKYIFPIVRCNDCAKKDSRFTTIAVKYEPVWFSNHLTDYYISKNPEEKSNWEKYFPYNLEEVKIIGGETIGSQECDDEDEEKEEENF